MRISDYLEFSYTNLWKMKLRTILTILGVIVGIGALVSMISFGRGIQKNVTDTFQDMELFNSITVYSESSVRPEGARLEEKESQGNKAGEEAVLDEKAIASMEKIKGVEAVFPEVRFPAIVRFEGNEAFRLIQAIPARIATSRMMKLRFGKSYTSDNEASVIVSDVLLTRLKVKDLASAVGRKIEVSSLTFDLSTLSPFDLPKILTGEKLPFSREKYEFTIVGVTERMGFGGQIPFRSDVFIAPGIAEGIKKLPFTLIEDIFRIQEGRRGYSVVNVRLFSPRYVDSVKERIQEMGFRTFALVDELEEIKTTFLYLDMLLFAVGMIALFVASLGIMNTMVMSILERYSEIGVMKAVGAANKDVMKIFFFESSTIGFMGGIFGFGLGWLVSRLINQVVNFFLSKQGVPRIDYFTFPWWLCLGAVGFAVLVSLVSGIYPAMRAARVDPVVALRHD